MNELQKEKLSQLIIFFANKANITDKNQIQHLINDMSRLNIDDAIDKILGSLQNLVQRKLLTIEDIIQNVDLILGLNDKYKSLDDLIARLNWLKAMNIEYPAMPLSENHKLVLETFDEFNKIIGNNFDAYYTGGMMAYLASGKPLERYHGDLDLFINEEQLLDLKKLIDKTPNFSFVSNMDHKETNGHEYKITYKDGLMSIGLFLFQRDIDQSIIKKEYYFENQDKNAELYVDKIHFTKKYTNMCFSDQVRSHNGIIYKMMSLESIYNSKKNSRPKDKYDASKIEDMVDLVKEHEIELENKKNSKSEKETITNSIIYNMENELLKTKLNSKAKQYLEMIEKIYSQYMNEEKKQLLTQLKASEIVIVEENTDKWLENQIQGIKNDDNLSEGQKQKEIDEIKQHKITAHGGKVFGDQKIHFYPANIAQKENRTLENVCEGILIHELLHYFISPEYINIPGVENSNNINSYITEGLVDMCARDLMNEEQTLEPILKTYNSNYASNVIFVREKFDKIESQEEKMNLIFQGNMEQIVSKFFVNSDKLIQEYSASKNKQTTFDVMIKQVAVSCDKERAQGIENSIYNISANAKNKTQAIIDIRNIGEKLYPEKRDNINDIIDNYEYTEKQNEKNEERKSLLQQKRNVEKQLLLDQKQNIEQQKAESINQDNGMTRKLVPNRTPQNSTNKNGFTNVLILSIITSGFVVLVALLTSLFIK